jgi:hypothetical protein
LTLADSGGVSESIFHALPDLIRNFYHACPVKREGRAE